MSNAFDSFSRALGARRSRRDVVRFLGASAVGGFLTMLGVGCSSQPPSPTINDEPTVSELPSTEKTAFEKKVFEDRGFQTVAADLTARGFILTGSSIIYSVQMNTATNYRIWLAEYKSSAKQIAELTFVETKDKPYIYAAIIESENLSHNKFFDPTKNAVINSSINSTADLQAQSDNKNYFATIQDINSTDCQSCQKTTKAVCNGVQRIVIPLACQVAYRVLSSAICTAAAGATATNALGFALCMGLLGTRRANICKSVTDTAKRFDCGFFSFTSCLNTFACTGKIPETCDCGCKTCDYNYSTVSWKCGGTVEGIECDSNNLCYSYNSHNCLSCPGTCSPSQTCCPNANKDNYICVAGTGSCCGSTTCSPSQTCCNQEICRDLQADYFHCGSCENDCSKTKPASTCVNGSCECRDPFPHMCPVTSFCCPFPVDEKSCKGVDGATGKTIDCCCPVGTLCCDTGCRIGQCL
jgi:hypothetical protein